MKLKKLLLGALVLSTLSLFAQEKSHKVNFTEYNLKNGLHVILHQDHSNPIVVVSVMYHVGSINENPQRQGFAHFFEHLMFEGSKNIKREQYMKLIQSAGGLVNANTTFDRTYFFEELPSNQTELALWMESERMLHLKIDSIGVATQRKVVKEEMKQRFENTPYGSIMKEVCKNLFTTSPYRWTPIGENQYINKAKLSEFMAFYHKFYVPNNATLCISGDINPTQVKTWITKYFSSIPHGTEKINRPTGIEPPQTKQKIDTVYDNIKLPAVIDAYHTPKETAKDYYAVSMLMQVLSEGKSSRLHKVLVDQKQQALFTGAIAMPLQNPGFSLMFAITNAGVNAKDVQKSMDEQIKKLQDSLISKPEFEKLQNQIEMQNAVENSKLRGISANLCTYHVFYGNTGLINTDIDNYKNVTRQDIQRVAKKYFKPTNRVVLYYLPKSQEKK